VQTHVLLRRIIFAALLAASTGVLLLSLYLVWNAHPWDDLPFIAQPATSAEGLNAKIDAYNRQADNLAKTIALLGVLSALYVIAFAVSTHLAAERYQSLCDQTVDKVRDEMAVLVGDLREIQEKAERAVERAAEVSGRAEELLRQQAAAKPAAGLSDSARVRYNLAVLKRSAGQLEDAEALLHSLLALPGTDGVLAAEARYELACTEASRGPEHFGQALQHLKEAFREKTPSIEKRISQDIDDGGPLQALAARAPFDKAINDLLLDVSVN
jgi:tetratricopeptide (TPR) repeat protein